MISPFRILKRQLTLSTHRIRELPILLLGPHSRCNCRCLMCDIWKGNRDRRELMAEDLEPIMADLRRLRVQRVVLTGGEPLMHSNLWQLCEMLRSAGPRLTLLSTGLLLSGNAAEVARYFDEVIVSLDGPPALHDEIRGVPRAYELLAEGIDALRSARPKLEISVRSVVQRKNFRLMSDTIESARKLGIDRISFLAADVSSEAFNRPEGWDEPRKSEVALDAGQAHELETLLEELILRHREDLGTGFLVERPEKLRDIGRYYLALSSSAKLPTVRCNAPWVSTVIEADGTVRPCFFHAPLGNLGPASLREILDSEQALAFRRNLDVASDPICQRCVCSLVLPPWRDA